MYFYNVLCIIIMYYYVYFYYIVIIIFVCIELWYIITAFRISYNAQKLQMKCDGINYNGINYFLLFLPFITMFLSKI